MDDKLYSIAYFSKSTINGSREDIANTIESILKLARLKNKERNITGALLYSGGYFSQVIEGPMDELEDLFEIIQNDPRHSEVRVLHFNPVEARHFSGWSMALAGVEDSMLLGIDEILKSPDELNTKQAGVHLINILHDLVQRHEDCC